MLVELFVIRENATRWNSSYASIHRALLLKPRLVAFLIEHGKELKEDLLSEDDWQVLADLERIFKPFQSVTKRLEGRAPEGV